MGKNYYNNYNSENLHPKFNLLLLYSNKVIYTIHIMYVKVNIKQIIGK